MKITKKNASVLSKLGSIAIHAKEMLSDSGHPFDRVTLTSLLDDSEVVALLADLDAAALLPKMRR